MRNKVMNGCKWKYVLSFCMLVSMLVSQPAGAQAINVVTDYGAIADALILSDASITSGSFVLSSPSHVFVAGDVGKQVALYNGGSSFGNGLGFHTTISSVSGGNAILAVSPGTTVVNGPAQICTDTATQFLNARNFLLTQNPTRYTLTIPPGTYCLSSNKWLKGIRNVDVSAYGANFITMTSNAGYQIDGTAMPFGGDIFSNQGDNGFDPSTNVTGSLINGAAINALSVTLKTPLESCNFQVGDDVLVFGFDSQGTASYPPAPRYFEYNTVTGVDSGTGIITLLNPLKYAYNGAWIDAAPVYDVTTGAPRLLDLNRTKMKISQNLTFSGGTFLTWYGSQNLSARQVSGTISISGGRNITVTDVNATGIFVGQTENINVVRGIYKLDARGDGYSELDKIVTNATVTGGTYQNLIQGTGIKTATFVGNTFLGQFQNFAETQVYIENIFNTDPSLNANYLLITGGAWWTPNQTFTGNTFQVTSGIGGITNHYNQIGFLVLASPSPTATSLAVTYSSGITQALEVGEVLSGTGGAAGKSFTISKFFCNPASSCVLTGTSSGGSPVAGDQYYNNSPAAPIVSSANIFADVAETIHTVPPTTTPVFDVKNGKVQYFSLSAGNVTTPTIVNGTVNGQALGFIICQTATSSNIFNWPANTNQAATPGTIPNLCSFMPFTWDASNTRWQAVLPNGGSANQPGGAPSISARPASCN
jgi:hypothetical protein